MARILPCVCSFDFLIVLFTLGGFALSAPARRVVQAKGDRTFFDSAHHTRHGTLSWLQLAPLLVLILALCTVGLSRCHARRALLLATFICAVTTVGMSVHLSVVSVSAAGGLCSGLQKLDAGYRPPASAEAFCGASATVTTNTTVAVDETDSSHLFEWVGALLSTVSAACLTTHAAKCYAAESTNDQSWQDFVSRSNAGRRGENGKGSSEIRRAKPLGRGSSGRGGRGRSGKAPTVSVSDRV